MKLAQEEHPIALKCPRCPVPMAYRGIMPNGTRVYSCPSHGEWHLREGQLFQPYASAFNDDEDQ